MTKIRIYQDPYTKQEFEGIAELVELLAVDEDGTERWDVRFRDGSVVQRIIQAEDRSAGSPQSEVVA